jgi:hypothetical protein
MDAARLKGVVSLAAVAATVAVAAAIGAHTSHRDAATATPSTGGGSGGGYRADQGTLDDDPGWGWSAPSAPSVSVAPPGSAPATASGSS